LDTIRTLLLNPALHALINATNAMTTPNVLSAKRTTSCLVENADLTVLTDMSRTMEHAHPAKPTTALLALLMEKLALLATNHSTLMTTSASLNAPKENGHY
jgi:thiamine phosphate synthase YjbQ (UPF0047 family)